MPGIWAPTPADIVVYNDNGSASMGDVTDEVSKARFKLLCKGGEPVGPYVLSWVRIHFELESGEAGGTADCVIRVDSRLGSFHDATLYTIEGLGATSSAVTGAFFRVQRDEYEKFVFQKGDELVFEWTTPDTGDLRWGIEIGLAPAEG